MPEDKSKSSAPSAPAPKPAAKPAPVLLPASESVDGAAHDLLARLDVARQVGNEQEEKAVLGALAEMGLSA